MVPTPERVDGTNGIKVFRDAIKFNAIYVINSILSTQKMISSRNILRL